MTGPKPTGGPPRLPSGDSCRPCWPAKFSASSPQLTALGESLPRHAVCFETVFNFLGSSLMVSLPFPPALLSRHAITLVLFAAESRSRLFFWRLIAASNKEEFPFHPSLLACLWRYAADLLPLPPEGSGFPNFGHRSSVLREIAPPSSRSASLHLSDHGHLSSSQTLPFP